jgi:hypothetical protein
MGMAINKTGGDNMALSIDDFLGAAANFSDCRNLASDDSNISLEAWHSGTINESPILNQ